MKNYKEILTWSKDVTLSEIYKEIEKHFIDHSREIRKRDIAEFEHSNLLLVDSSYIQRHYDERIIESNSRVDLFIRNLNSELEQIHSDYPNAYDIRIAADEDNVIIKFHYHTIEPESTADAIGKSNASKVAWKLNQGIDTADLYSVYNRVYEFSKKIGK